jgi:hypothetical protein
MQTLFEGKPWQVAIVKVGIVVFLGFSIYNLYLNIKVNKQILDKQNGTT